MEEREEREEHEEVHDELAADADRMEKGVEELGEQVDELRDDWQAKQQDSAVPGANPPDEAEGDDRPSETDTFSTPATRDDPSRP